MRSIIAFLCLLLTASSQAQTFSVLHRFARDGVDGEAASTTLTCSSNMLIGITARGGINGGGILYKVTTNGSSYQILHQFAPQGNNWFGGDLTADGSCPVGGLAIDGETIYGATQTGGGGGSGSIYKVKTDGSSYGILHSFLYAHEGSYPGSGLILEDGLLYGSCMFAGMDDRPSFPYLSAAGIHYGIHTNGSGYHIRGTFQKYPHRGRDGGLPPPLPPNRTGGFPASGSPVSDSSAEIGSLGHGLWPARTARSPRSKRLAIVDGLAFVPSFSGGSVSAGWL